MIEMASDAKSFAKAVRLLNEGEVVAIPTETVYGLAAKYNDQNAIEKIFEAKGRPKNDPLIVHISNERQLELLVTEIPIEAKQLIQSFWPGPLTLVLKKKHTVSNLITSGLATVAVRMPKHDVAKRLIESVGVPLVAPSANRFQSISPTNAEAVYSELHNRIPLILDGGECERGIESTVVTFDEGVKILRLGAIPVEDIELSLGMTVQLQDQEKHDESAPQVAPGLLKFHYAPKSALKVIDSPEHGPQSATWIVFSNYERDLARARGVKDIFVLSPKGDFAEAGQKFFATLRKADLLRHPIVALKLPETGVGRAINDRLTRATHS